MAAGSGNVEPAEVAAPALGYSILANLGDEKQLTVQCFVDSEEPLSSIHVKLDKAMAVVDRQKAKYRVKDLRKELDKDGRTLRQLEEDLTRVEAQFQQNQEAIDEQIRLAADKREEIAKLAYGKGRSGPVGHDAAHSNALKKQIEQLVADKAKAEAERKQARDNIAVSIVRYNDEIERLKEQVAECEALISGEGS